LDRPHVEGNRTVRDIDVLLDFLSRLTAQTAAAIDGLAAEALAWQPDPAANGIGVTVWHFSRWMDFVNVRALQDRPAEDELWFRDGWAARTGYDPRGLGYGGLGALTGYTLEEALAVPALTTAELLRYLTDAVDALATHLRASDPATLHQPASGLRTLRDDLLTPYAWITAPLLGGFAHVGEIRALRALWERRMALSHQPSAIGNQA